MEGLDIKQSGKNIKNKIFTAVLAYFYVPVFCRESLFLLSITDNAISTKLQYIFTKYITNKAKKKLNHRA